jgi:molecular chaperone GrpE
MTDTREKGSFQTDIPADAVEEALRSVERVTHRHDDAAAEVAIETDAGDPDDAGASPELASLRAQLELSQAKGRELLEKLKEEHEKLLRTAADLENYKKRAAKEREEMQRFGNEKLLKDVLPVVDNLDRALAAASADDALTAGVKLVRASFESALAKHAVKSFSALGAPFDPARHEALLQVPTAESPPGTVVLEHARGFTLSERLLRPALVGVAVAPPASEGSESTSAGGPPGEGT